MATINRSFKKKNDKKHSIQFEEIMPDGEEATLSTIYVKRTALKLLDNADGSKEIKVTLTVGK
jgi:hypothetical protein